MGSITHVTDASGTVVQEMDYDAWGRLRDAATQVAYAPDNEPSLFLGRGYTGHEHLPWFGLINMNARLYDPAVGRFLNPDPYVQAPGFTQSFNRYSYALNNPLKYTDPDGEFWHIIIGAVVGGTVNLISNWGNIDGNFWKGLGYFGVGAGVGALSAVTGAWVSTATQAVGLFAGAGVGALTGAATGGASSLLLNGGNNLLNGDKFSHNWKSNLTSGAISGAIGGAIGGGIKGWKNAEKLGANKWTGSKTLSKNSYSTNVKAGIPPQTDNTKHCYSVSGEYADSGHGNLSRNDFQSAAARLNNGVIPDGADIGYVAREAGLNAGTINMGTSDLNQFGTLLQSGTMEGILTVGTDVSAGHTVNVVSFDVIEKLKLFGGGTKFIFSNANVWDPSTGTARLLRENILKFTYIRY